ncbi:MAG TPA: glycosyltransferase family 4 protein [Nocardioidaceae bacterium]|nr:glycosyltransferase family 4 protein [Nocardioidaceae bacterium]
MTIRRAVDRLRHHARRPLARTPYVWDVAMLARPDKRSTLARRDTAIVIEGFLRSGNTFSVAAFAVANGPGLHVGRHLHGAPHVLRAVRLGLPTLVLIRRPADAVSSYLIRRPTLTADDALLEYLDFYRTTWPMRHGFVVGLFDDVVNDFGSVISTVNQRFGTSFVPYRPTPENEAAAFALVEEMNRLECRGEVVETHVGRPSAERDSRKMAIRQQMQLPRTQALLAEADHLYERYSEFAATRYRDVPTVRVEGDVMTRVLLVGKGAPDRGGIPSFLNDLRTGALAHEHEITFLNVAHHGTPEGGEASVSNVARTLKDAVAVWRSARGHDVVHINSALAPTVTVLRAGLLALAGRARGCAVVVHAHGGNIETWLTTRRARLVMRVAMSPAHAVVAVWTAGHRALSAALGEQRVCLVDNGVDASRYAEPEPPHRPPRVLYVGLLTPRKGVLDLIQASRMLREEGVEHELWLLGGTPDEGPAAAEPVHAAAENHAVLLGTRLPEEMPDAYAAADVFCLPSWWEAMPLSVLEAMAAGLPVVATDVGDVARVVQEGKTGYVVPKQAPEQLAAALRKLLTDPGLSRRMGQAGRLRAEQHFSSTVTAHAVGDLYARVLGGRR